MSEHMFGVTKIKGMTPAQGNKIDKIAKGAGARFTGPIDIPGNETKGWFTCRNLGAPFDRATELEVQAELIRKAPKLVAKFFPSWIK